MAKVLYVKANPKPLKQSVTLQVADGFIRAYKDRNPGDTVEEYDVYGSEFRDFDRQVIGAVEKAENGEELNLEEEVIMTARRKVLAQFKAADKYIFASPLWNLGIPARLKAYIDAIVIAGETFRYDETGAPVGLLASERRKAVAIVASGGVYGAENPINEYATSYLKGILSFMGIADTAVIMAQGTAFLDAQTVIDQALLTQVPTVLEQF